MKIVIACDSFKGSLSSLEAGGAASEGVRISWPDASIEVVGIADGGEGTIEALSSMSAGEVINITVRGPLGQPVKADYVISGSTAVIEIARACGLTLVDPSKRDPGHASSFGVGEIILDALARGCRKFIIGLGGSATNDAGAGMLKALGFGMKKKNGEDIGPGGITLKELYSIDSTKADPRLKESKFTIASDVKNPLCGENGASKVFGPQKGAALEMVMELDSALMKFAEITSIVTGLDLSNAQGAGAAGGLGFAFLSYLNSEIKPGIDVILDAVGFDRIIEDASLIITGEGRMDKQTVMGKAPYGVLKRAQAKNIPIVGICGTLDPEAILRLNQSGFLSVFPIQSGPVTLRDAISPENTRENIRRTVSQIINLLRRR